MKIAYTRVSSESQNTDLQNASILQLCPDKDLAIYAEKQSAWKDVKRPVFEQVLSLIKSGKVKHLYVFDLDRLYRSRKRLQGFFQICQLYGTKIHSFNQGWLEQLHSIPPPFNEMMFDLLINLMGWLSEEESTKKSNRVKNAVVRKKDGTYSYTGKKWGRKGFPKQTIDRVLALADSGLSIREIAGQIKTYDQNRNEKPISKSAVHKIIRLYGTKNLVFSPPV